MNEKCSEKGEYIKLISTYDTTDRYWRWLIALMDTYNKPNLTEITLEEAKDFWHKLKEKQNGEI